jgi:hypothetical protein
MIENLLVVARRVCLGLLQLPIPVLQFLGGNSETRYMENTSKVFGVYPTDVNVKMFGMQGLQPLSGSQRKSGHIFLAAHSRTTRFEIPKRTDKLGISCWFNFPNHRSPGSVI